MRMQVARLCVIELSFLPTFTDELFLSHLSRCTSYFPDVTVLQNISLAITIKHRRAAGEVEAMNIVGEIKGKHCIIVDDMIDTAGTLCKSADSLREMGALSVSACCTHALFSGENECNVFVGTKEWIPMEMGVLSVPACCW